MLCYVNSEFYYFLIIFQQGDEEGWSIEKMSDNDIMDVSTFLCNYRVAQY